MKIPYEVFHELDTNRTVIVIRDLDITLEQAKTIANRHFKVNVNMLCARMGIVKGNTVRYDEADVNLTTSNAIVVTKGEI